MDVLSLPIVQKLFTVVINPLIQLLFAGAVAYFIFGVFQYVRKSDDSDAVTQGSSHIFWGTVGLAIMFSVWGIIALLKRTLGA